MRVRIRLNRLLVRLRLLLLLRFMLQARVERPRLLMRSLCRVWTEWRLLLLQLLPRFMYITTSGGIIIPATSLAKLGSDICTNLRAPNFGFYLGFDFGSYANIWLIAGSRFDTNPAPWRDSISDSFLRYDPIPG